MPEYRYEFSLILAGHGPNREEAWENAVESFVQDPGAAPAVTLREGVDKED